MPGPSPPAAEAEGQHGDATDGAAGGSQGGQHDPPRVTSVVQDHLPLAPPTFSGSPLEDATAWAQQFERYCIFRQLGRKQAANLFPLLLKESALFWFNDKFPVAPDTIENVLKQFRERFGINDNARWRKKLDLWHRQQGATEDVEAYIMDINRKANKLSVTPDDMIDILIQGFRPEIRSFVMQRDCKTAAEVCDAARLAQSCNVSSSDTVTAAMAAQLDRQYDMMRSLQTKLDRLSLTGQSSTVHSIDCENTNTAQSHRATWTPRRAGNRRNSAGRSRSTSLEPKNRNKSPSPIESDSTTQRQFRSGASGTCHRCLLQHSGRCFAETKRLKCFRCGGFSHLARACRSRQIRKQY